MLSPHDRLAIAELILYGGTILPCSLYLWVKEGWRRLEWLFVWTLATLRIVGTIVQLQHDDSGPPSSFTSIAIVNGIGLSPLLGITLMLVHRLCKIARNNRLANITIFLHIVTLGAIPLLIVGILKLFQSSSDKTLGRILAAIGLAIFLQIYVVQSFVAIYVYNTSSMLKKKPSSYLAMALFAMTPLLLLRLLYSALSFFVTSSTTFNPVIGSIAAQVLLAVLPENLIALCAVGWGLVNVSFKHKGAGNEAYDLGSGREEGDALVR